MEIRTCNFLESFNSYISECSKAAYLLADSFQTFIQTYPQLSTQTLHVQLAPNDHMVFIKAASKKPLGALPTLARIECGRNAPLKRGERVQDRLPKSFQNPNENIFVGTRVGEGQLFMTQGWSASLLVNSYFEMR